MAEPLSVIAGLNADMRGHGVRGEARLRTLYERAPQIGQARLYWYCVSRTQSGTYAGEKALSDIMVPQGCDSALLRHSVFFMMCHGLSSPDVSAMPKVFYYWTSQALCVLLLMLCLDMRCGCTRTVEGGGRAPPRSSTTRPHLRACRRARAPSARRQHRMGSTVRTTTIYRTLMSTHELCYVFICCWC